MNSNIYILIHFLYFFSAQLLALDYLPCLISLVSKDRTDCHEHVLLLLITLIEDNPEAITECQSSKYNLKEIIHRLMNFVRNKEECQVRRINPDKLILVERFQKFKTYFL